VTITRRTFLLDTAAYCMLAIGCAHAEGPILTAEGLYKEPWFLRNVFDLTEALELTAKQGKRFVIMWEIKGCTYCKETHLVNFAKPRIADYVKSNFNILQLNIIGSRKVTDFDGIRLSERQLAAKYSVRFTPTFLFFPEGATALKTLPPRQREVARAAGYLRPDDFLAYLRFVREKAYEKQSFRDFYKSEAAKPASPTCDGEPLQELPLLLNELQGEGCNVR
jgi:thioredoxin-related protein